MDSIRNLSRRKCPKNKILETKMNYNETSRTRWENLTLANNYIFCRLMEDNPDMYREILEKRARYYSSIMDVDSLSIGEGYESLKTSYVIFLCLNDPFRQGLKHYTFRNRCDGNGMSLDDGVIKVFYNVPKCVNMDDERKEIFFRLLQGKPASGQFADKLTAMMEKVKQNIDYRRQFMTWEQTIQEAERRAARKAAEEAHEQGLNEGIEKIAAAMLADGMAVEKVIQLTGLSEEQVQKLESCQSTIPGKPVMN